jgi:WD40 repeat protein
MKSEHIQRKDRHNRTLLAAFALLLALTLACGGGNLFQEDEAATATARAKEQVEAAAKGQDPTESLTGPTPVPDEPPTKTPTATPTPSPQPLVYTADGKPCPRPATFQSIVSIEGQSPLDEQAVADAVLARLAGAEAPVSYVAVSPNGQSIATLEGRRTRLWSARAGRPSVVREFTNQEDRPLGRPAFSPDGRLLAIPFAGGLIRLIDTEGGRETFSFNAGAGRGNTFIGALAFHPDGRRLAAADGPVALLYDVQDGRELLRFEGIQSADSGPTPIYEDGHALEIETLSFTSDGQALLTAAIDGTVRLWDAQNGRPLRCYEDEGASRDPFWSAAISPDGLLIAGQQADSVYVWDAQSGEILRRFDWTAGDAFSSVTFKPQGQTLLTASEDRTVRAWDAGDGTLLGLMHHPVAVNWATYVPDGSRVVTALGTNFFFGAEPVNEAWLWDAGHPELILGAEAQNLFEEAIALLAAGDLTGARARFAQAQALNPYVAYDLEAIALQRDAGALIE